MVCARLERMAVQITTKILKKLQEQHGVTRKEVVECFHNQGRSALKDTREDHQTDPATFWIISETNHCRVLKLIFMVSPEGDVILKSAYEPEPRAVEICDKYARYL